MTDGETLTYGGGITMVATPGHTPGHLSLYHSASKTLVAGDALRVDGGELLGADPRATLDAQEGRRALGNLLLYDIEAVICYHGGLYRGDVRQRLAELA